MKVLFIKHIDIEGPETLLDFFRRKGAVTETIELYNAGSLPSDLRGIDAVVSLGGPMNVYEEEKYPFLKNEDVFIRRIIAEGRPFLGICLGAQLLAKAAGIKVGKSPEPEIGFYPVYLTEKADSDPLFQGLPAVWDVFQWHEDMVELPAQAHRLAYSQKCPCQAFKIGACAYGFQFHVEVTGETIQSWAEAYFPATDPVQARRKKEMLDDYQQKKELFHRTAQKVYNNFFEIIQKSKGESVRDEDCGCSNQSHRG